MAQIQDEEILNKWRLVLGKYAEGQISLREGQGQQYQVMDDVLDFLYGREYEEEEGVRSYQGGSGESRLTVPEWLARMKSLFPKDTVEIMEKHAIEKYHMLELITDKEVLESMEPNVELLKTIMNFKHMMKGEVLESAKRIVRRVAADLTERLKKDVESSRIGRINRNKSSSVRTIRNLDLKRTIKANLKNYQMEKQKLYIEHIYFNGYVRKFNTYRIIIAIDESGSMLDSVIHSAIMAGIFASLPMLDTKLIIFDTNVVDLSGYIDDPVQTLMSVQLGGGTNIAGALAYCDQLIEIPAKTIVVLVTDLFEGGGYPNLYAAGKRIMEGGSKLLVLTALDSEAEPNYDKHAAAVLAEMGAEVAAMTPKYLADWVGNIIG